MEKYLTIAIPTYNREKLVDRLLHYLEPQLLDEVEVLVIDNASTDNTYETVKKKYPNVLCCRNPENIGAHANFLKCYKRASGRYVWLVGSDDIVADGAVSKIVKFIKANIHKEMPIIFLNHNSFEGKYEGNNNFSMPFLSELKDELILNDKKEFINYTRQQLTFMSSFILQKSSVEQIENPQQYIDTRFLHTCLAFKSTEKSDIMYGIIGYVCVSQDLTPSNSGFHKNYVDTFNVFGRKMKYVLVDLASQCGYNSKQLKKVYIKSMFRTLIGWTIRMRARSNKEEYRAFWNYCYPAIKEYIRAWLFIIPIAILPSFVSKLYLHIKGEN